VPYPVIARSDSTLCLIWATVNSFFEALILESPTGRRPRIAITAKVGQKLEPLPEGASYLGFIFSRGSAPADVERSLREALAKLRFQVAGTLPVMR